MKHLDDSLLREITERLVTEFQPDKIYLFGSHAWGVPTDNSDLDLFIIVPESDLSPVKRAVRAYRCLRGMSVTKDIIVRTRAEVEKRRGVHSSLECEVLERGRLLYG